LSNKIYKEREKEKERKIYEYRANRNKIGRYTGTG